MDKPQVDMLILGPSRSGTTLASKLFAHLGYAPIGQGIVNENSLINEEYISRNGNKFRHLAREAILSTSSPNALKLTVQGERRSVMPFLDRNLRIEKIILVFKSSMATALRRQFLHGGDLSSHLQNVLADQMLLAELLRCDTRARALDVDVVSTSPSESLKGIAEEFGLTKGDLGVESFIRETLGIQKKRYLDSTQLDENFFSEVRKSSIYLNSTFT